MSLSEPRSQIRLLEIEAGVQDEPLSAKLIVCERRNAPPYLAISYTWGDDKDQRELLLDGRTFRAGTNCYRALWQARLHFAPCLIWIDSICINQDDWDEKSIQVNVMGDIYRHAQHVLARIGPHSNDSQRMALFARSPPLKEEAKESPNSTSPWWLRLPFFLSAWWRNIPASYVLRAGYPSPIANYLIAIAIIKHLAANANRYFSSKVSTRGIYITGLSAPFHALAQRPYWKRLWIIQELVQARQICILCGQDQFPWEDILLLKQMLERVDSLPDSALVFTDLGEIIKRKFVIPEDLVNRFSGFQCRDPRDRLFGLLSLIVFSKPSYGLSGEFEIERTRGNRENLWYAMDPPIADYDVPALRWAAQLVKYIKFHMIPRLLTAFDIQTTSDGMCDLVSARRLPLRRTEPRLNRLLDGPRIQYPCDFTFESGFCRINYTEDNIIADLRKEVREFSSLLEIQRFEDFNNQLMELVTALGRLSNTPQGQFVQTLRVDGELAAIACANVRKGDVLVRIKPAPGGQVFIILRKSQRNYSDGFDIVGQGFAVNGYGIDDHKYTGASWPPWNDHIYHNAGTCSVTLRITPEDAVLLIGQDFIDEETYDVQARIDRLRTSVTTCFQNAAKVNYAYCGNGSDRACTEECSLITRSSSRED